ncbi:hypothetical protein XACW160_610012 [Xanthomonas citri pv. citri]|nr:hypothetical protein XACW160_610012 [Xanthomonas citri pv. citri]
MMVSPSVTVARPTSSAALTGKTKTTSNDIQRFNNLNRHFLSNRQTALRVSCLVATIAGRPGQAFHRT